MAKDKKEKKEKLESTGKPIIQNPDGTISTERSITVTHPGLNSNRPTNIPTIVGGKQLKDSQAVEAAIAQQAAGYRYPSYDTIDLAVAAAKQRSEQLGRDYQEQKRKKK